MCRKDVPGVLARLGAAARLGPPPLARLIERDPESFNERQAAGLNGRAVPRNCHLPFAIADLPDATDVEVTRAVEFGDAGPEIGRNAFVMCHDG